MMKMKNKSNFSLGFKIISIFLVIATCVVSLPITAFASYFNKDEVQLPDVVQSDTSSAMDYIERLKEQEADLYSFLFGKTDGSIERIIYNYPVKYLNADGIISDKSNEIIRETINGISAFVSKANDIKASFPTNLRDGVSLVHEGVNVKMVYAPAGVTFSLFSSFGRLSNDNYSVSYPIDSKTSIEYALTYNGFKEDIVVSEYTGQTEYSFVLYTDGLAVEKIGENFFLVNNEGDICVNIGDVVVFTADERNNFMGTMRFDEIVPNEKYILTIHLDNADLSDPNTAYPIRIDPTLEINYTNNGSGAIEDIVINSADPHSGTETVLKIGKHSDDSSVSRALMRFPSLDVEGLNIVSARIELRDIMCESTSMQMDCYEYVGTAWTESAGISWDDISNLSYIGEYQDTQYVFYGNGNVSEGGIHIYSFDITDVAKKWAVGTSDPATGILFKASDDHESTGTYYKTFGSYNRSTYRPVLTIAYVDASGLNPTYSYNSTQLGDNVVLYDNAAFGNMIISHNITVPTMNEFPLELGLIYNSTFSDSQFFDKYGLASTTYGKFGKGWKPTFVEYVVLEDDRYLYVDGSGAEYYFVYDADHDNFINEALGAELSIDSSSNVTLIIDDIVRVFNTNGLLSSVTCNKKTYTYTYSSGKLTSISSAEGNSISFTYSSNLLSKISCQVTLGTTVYTNSYSFTYSSEVLTAISDVYGNKITYATTDTSINVYDNLNAYGYYYTLNTNGIVTNYKYYRKNRGYIINDVTVSRGIGTTIYNDAYGLTRTTYVFDDNSRTVNLLVTDSIGSKVYDMSFATYDEELTSGYVVNPDKTNLIYNSSFESTNGWYGYITSSSEVALFGNSSAVLSPTYSNQSFIATSVDIIAETDYTFSAYVNYDSINNTADSPQGGIKLSVIADDGSVVAESFAACPPKNATDIGWFRVTLPFNVTTDGSYTFKISTVNSNGNIYVDAVQLERASTAGTYSALSLSSVTVARLSSFYNTIDLNSGNTGRSFIYYSSIIPQGRIRSGDVYVTLSFECGEETYSVDLPFTGSTRTLQYVAYEVNIPDSYSAPSSVTATINNTSNYPITYYFPGISFGSGSYVNDTEYSTGLVYTSNNDGTCTLTGIGTFTGTDVIIPSTNPATGEIVTGISNSVFYNNTNIESVVVPGTVEELSNAVFSSCTSLTSVVLEDGVKSIGGSAFYGCTSLVDVSLPESLTTIGTYAFHNCTALTEIYIPDSVTSISTCVFYKCTALENVYLGNGITTIANSTFNECTSLKSITLPDGITSLGAYAFNNCTALRAIGFPKSISSLANGSIYNCSPNLKIYYSGSSAEWNAISQGTNSLPTPCVVVPNTELNGNFTYTYTYDSNGNISSTEISYLALPDDGSINADALMFTSVIYDVNGNMTSYTDESGATTTYTYDRYGNVLTVTDARGVTTTYTYDSCGRLTSVSAVNMTNAYTYTDGLLTQVVHSGSNGYTETYTFIYNSYGNLGAVKVGSRNLVTYMYDFNGRGMLLTTTYANGTYEAYSIDDLGNQVALIVNDYTRYTWAYDYAGNLYKESDIRNGTVTIHYMNEFGYTAFSSVYDTNGNNITLIAPEYNISRNETTDVYDRKISEMLTADEAEIIIKNFTYQSNGSYSSYLVASESFSDGTTEDSNTFSYTYDAVGNLTSISENGIIKQKFTYDNLSQLIREDNAYICKSYVYEYDGNGNILKKREYTYTTGTLGTATDTIAYGYGDSSWKDLLTSYDGTTISYDASGNPLNWRNATKLQWTGRQLDYLRTTDGKSLYFLYNSDGLRTEKTVNDVEYSYVWENGVLAYQSGGGYELYFNYVDGDLVGFTYVEGGTETDYYYGKNNIGEIRYIYDDSGNIVVTYTYDAWGTPISVTGSRAISVGQINPIRYKDYYYDTETGLYYLQSRYYDATVGRFLNSDKIDFIGATGALVSYNMFVYCENNPISHVDPYGYLRLETTWVGFSLDIIFTLLPQFFSKAYDIIGITLSGIFNRHGKKFFVDVLLKSAVPKVIGIFSSFFTLIRTAIWRVTGALISNSISLGVSTLLSKIANMIMRGKIDTTMRYITMFFSTGSVVAGLFDLFTDGEMNGKIVF